MGRKPSLEKVMNARDTKRSAHKQFKKLSKKSHPWKALYCEIEHLSWKHVENVGPLIFEQVSQKVVG